jgi:hypothetical protein
MSVIDEIAIPGGFTGPAGHLAVHRYGTREALPRTYIQAGLHADEAPGLLVAQHLKRQFDALEARGDIVGEIVLVPVANPIGLAQWALGRHEGRFDVSDGVNFNRGFPDVVEVTAQSLAGRLTNDAEINRRLLISALLESVSLATAVTPAEHLKRMLLWLAIGADTVLDLHCDGEAVTHLYTLPSQADAFAPLARLVAAQAHLVADVSGGQPFDEAVSRPPVEIAARFPQHPFPPPSIATTLELRGLTDVDQTQAATDAKAVVAYLTLRGQLRGARPELPTPTCTPTPLAGCEALTAPHAGLLTYAVSVGTTVRRGDHVADITDLSTGNMSAIHAATTGVLFARAARRLVTAGARIGKIAGPEAIRTGDLLSP